MTKRFVLGGFAAAATILASAAPAAAASFTWSGPYIGLNVGGAFSNGQTAKTTGTAGFLTLVPTLAPAALGNDASSLIGGGQVGYNVQSGPLVYGLEADFDGLNASKTASFASTASVLGTTLTTTAAQKVDYIGTVRVRVGFTPAERILVYATGGLAYGDVKNTASVVANAAPTSLFWTGGASGVRTGYAAGAGAEYAFDDHVSVRGEYLYYGLGSRTVGALGNPGVRGVASLDGIDYVERTPAQGSIVRVAVSYRF